MYGSLSIQDRERKFNAITQRTRPPMRCPAMPWLPDQVTSTLMELIAQGVRDEESLTLTTLYEVYDETVHGEPIIWPTIPDDCAEMKAIEERVRIRVRLVLAELIDAEADEIYPP